MTDEQIIELVELEIKNKSLGVTSQYFEIHSPVYINNKPKIERIDRENKETTIVYLPVFEEKFFFSFFINNEEKRIIGVHTEPWHRVYFTATSDKLSFDKLKSLTKLIPTSGWNNGDLRPSGNSRYNFSKFNLLPNPEPDEFEDKLKKLLDLLLTDMEGVKQLVSQANGHIQVAMNIHNANGMPGGPTIDKDSILKMSKLGLEINFDLYLEGSKFKS
ncbi:MAG TPA: DUF4279 domain-containing protein [Flavobacteriales bacterium]|nr:DUF4279 domain-containing protein [Flavobacteriales bacterium]